MNDIAGIQHGMDESTYHARPELSSTEARIILDSPAKYRWKKDHPPLIEPSKKFDLGSAVHSKVLGVGYEVAIVPVDFLASNGAASTREAKDFIQNARLEGKIPLKLEEFKPIALQAESVLAHPSARALFDQPGDAEVSVFAEVDGVPCRARFDYLPDQGERRRVAVDLKTARDASPRGFTKSIAEYGYDVQRQWYLDALNTVTGPMPYELEPELVFVAVEKEAPYLVGVYQLPTIWTAMGATKAARARKVYAECARSNTWPGYEPDIQLLSPPTWLLYRHEEDYPNE